MLSPLYASATDASQVAEAPQPPSAALTPLETRILGVGEANPDPETVMQGALEARFGPFQSSGSHFLTGIHWFRIQAPVPGIPGTTPVLVARSGLDQSVRVWARQGGQAIRLRLTTSVPKFGGAEDKVFALPAGLDPGSRCMRRSRARGVRSRTCTSRPRRSVKCWNRRPRTPG